MVLVVWLTVGLATLALLAIMGIGLLRHLKVLTGSLRRFRDEVHAALEEVQKESAEAQRRLERISERRGGRLRP
ncbi:MAG: hypothetical protein E6G44_02035 [Actinobacteria bacterium]|nr:MAG: hypothetical protein E6G44_02035 [Actinomycetota bacterium]